MVSFSDLAYYTCGRWGAWTVDGLLVFTQVSTFFLFSFFFSFPLYFFLNVPLFFVL